MFNMITLHTTNDYTFRPCPAVTSTVTVKFNDPLPNFDYLALIKSDAIASGNINAIINVPIGAAEEALIARYADASKHLQPEQVNFEDQHYHIQPEVDHEEVVLPEPLNEQFVVSNSSDIPTWSLKQNDELIQDDHVDSTIREKVSRPLDQEITSPPAKRPRKVWVIDRTKKKLDNWFHHHYSIKQIHTPFYSHKNISSLCQGWVNIVLLFAKTLCIRR